MFTFFDSRHGRVIYRDLWRSRLVLSLAWLILFPFVEGSSRLSALRQDTSYLFYHGFDNYMNHAFPEDELRPLTCKAFTRDSSDQNHWELNDPLGNYSLTLIDSLSTLAVLASSSQSKADRKKAFGKFQDGVRAVIKLYGNGDDGVPGDGERAHGFDIDSKVQVFETAIRGLGGLLSAHLFAVGDLPIRDYHPVVKHSSASNRSGIIKWSRKFSYDGQLLRLAHDLGRRLLPAFSTQTGIPYPRVNLRHGIPFYSNAPQNTGIAEADDNGGAPGQCPAVPHNDDERTETCSAGAGSLVLEFATLSRLTGDERFESLAKRAFWAVWSRRMPTDLVGSGIDAETGEWKGPPSTGIGAGVDSFYEYAIKSHVLLSGGNPRFLKNKSEYVESLFEPPPLSTWEESADSFLEAWQTAHRAIKRHVFRNENAVHPHYTQVNLFNAAQQANWIDSLSAFYSGALVLAGQVEEAAVTHLLFTALWTRYAAIPERWSTATGDIEHGLPWWPGRPEFIESAYYLYRATDDPWYIHVGEMTLRDIRRRCWTPCGWAGIQDVRTGELTDRMESFFLGETVKYLHLLFDPEHPLNKLDAPWVFSTEGHPLILPRASKITLPLNSSEEEDSLSSSASELLFHDLTCPRAPPALPLTVSNTAARPDLFHAAALARLHWSTPNSQQGSSLLEANAKSPGISVDDVRSPTNYSFYPWTLPQEYVPPTGTCAPIVEVPTFHITFPTPTSLVANGPNHRTMEGIFLNSLSGLRLSMIQEADDYSNGKETFRINAINSQPIGRDEQVFLNRDSFTSILPESDPNFSRVRDPVNLQLVIDVPSSTASTAQPEIMLNRSVMEQGSQAMINKLADVRPEEHNAMLEALAGKIGTGEGALASALRYIADKVSSRLSRLELPALSPHYDRMYMNAITASGKGAAPLPNAADAPPSHESTHPRADLTWGSVFGAGRLCDRQLLAGIAQSHEILVLKRGGCSFSEKLENIPSFRPVKGSLELIVLVNDLDSDIEDEGDGIGRVSDIGRASFRPVLDKQQRTPTGLLRRHPIPMIMVDGGDAVYGILEQATALGIRRYYTIQAQGVPINNVHIL